MSEKLDEISGIKWEILEQLSKNPSSPKQLAEKLKTTIANVSYQLKLLEAYNYIKSKRVDRGKGSRKNRDTRIIYSIAKTRTQLIHISEGLASKSEIKQTPLNHFLINLLILDSKDETSAMLKFYLDFPELVQEIEALYYLKTENKEIHLLVITEQIEMFRAKNSRLELKKEPFNIVFWSHTLPEFHAGLERKEKYFLEKLQEAKLLFEKKPIKLEVPDE